MSTKKDTEIIKSLTPEQEALLPVWRDRWIEVGLCTDPADRPRAEAGFRGAYESAGLTPPKTIEWFQSPEAAAKRAAELAGTDVSTQVWQAAYGLHDASWVGWADFFEQVVGLDLPKLAPLREITLSSGWWWPFETLVIASERPCFVARDDRGRLHCENRAAIEYPDGFGVYSWHGVRLPKDVIMQPDSITVERIEAETNSEIRRVMVERYGEGRYLENSGAKVIHKDKYGELLMKEVRDDEPIVMVKVINSTPEPDGTFKTYMIQVPQEMKTARQAVAWTFGLEEKEYKPSVET